MKIENVKTENGKLPIFGVSHSALQNLLEDVRAWNNEWDKYNGTGKKPKSIDDYMDELNKKYVVGYTHCD
ncbi:MAG: hypothetical protein ACOCVF_00740 [bacterium]